jgi:gliding motility-associated-like protein
MFPLDATPSNLGENSATYEWTYNGELVENDGPVLNPDDFGFGTYEVNVYFDSPECNSTDSITFSQRNIGVNITSDDVDNLFCINETVTFNATLENAEMAEADFEWFVNEQLQSSMTSTLENYEITSNQPNQTVRVEVSVGTECFVSEELSFSLYAIDNCVISQGLSPNEDGDNDNLDLRFLDDRSNIISFDVFNRYGQRVYGKADYRDEFVGQSDNGNMLETGTYFYVIKFENEDPVYGRVHKGWIYINREQ